MNFEEKTLNSKLIYDGKVMKIIRYEIVTANGYKSFREVVVHNGGVVIVALTNDNKIILVKQFRYPLKRTILEVPAGKLEKDENPDDAAKRELEEETGYRAKNWKSLGYINTTPGICTEKLYLYFASDLEYVGDHPDKGEVLQCFEYGLDEIYKMIQDGEINDSKTICAVTRAFCKGFTL
ncbi:MAG: NUDIX hydrolase [Cyanobacteriota bacterium]|nr:NUDIX hydrolase [Cyanobacteriota bacterium]MDY6358478.1 NUDIX hydrolase [Cyanobacteriota bacterium]MDY6363532.1 NUDIX hydrolase [Cyanobacteriota bacterium]MDY6383432.1 NUDIX hydrolase [Cyanobacteriota bacterium]